MHTYFVTALDTDGYTIGSYESGFNKTVALSEARGSLRGDHEWRDAGMVRVTVTDDEGTVHFDKRI